MQPQICKKHMNYKGADYYVFGHTQMNKPLITDRFACLDTHQAYYHCNVFYIKAGIDRFYDFKGWLFIKGNLFKRYSTVKI